MSPRIAPEVFEDEAGRTVGHAPDDRMAVRRLRCGERASRHRVQRGGRDVDHRDRSVSRETLDDGSGGSSCSDEHDAIDHDGAGAILGAQTNLSEP